MKYEETARRIRKAMSDMGLTQQELANKASVGKSSISHYVNGTNEPGNKTAYILAKVLNVNPAWLMGLDVPMEPAASFEPAAPVEQCTDIVLTELESEIIARFRRADEFDRETILRTLHIKRDGSGYSMGTENVG